MRKTSLIGVSTKGYSELPSADPVQPHLGNCPNFSHAGKTTLSYIVVKWKALIFVAFPSCLAMPPPIPSLSHCSHLLSPSLSLRYSPHSQSPPSLGRRICAMYLRPTFSFWRASVMLHKLLVFYLFPHFSTHPAFIPSGTGNN